MKAKDFTLGTLAGIVLGAAGLSGIQNLTTNKENEERTSALPYSKRVKMFEKGIGLPPDYHKKGWGEYPGFIHDQKAILRNICLDGDYNPSIDNEWVNQDHADELLYTYGWKREFK